MAMSRVKINTASQDVFVATEEMERISLKNNVIADSGLVFSKVPVRTPWFTRKGSDNEDLQWRLCTLYIDEEITFYLQASTNPILENDKAIPDVLKPPNKLGIQTKNILYEAHLIFGDNSLFSSYQGFISTGILYPFARCNPVMLPFHCSFNITVHITYFSPIEAQTPIAPEANSRLARENLTSALKDRLFSDVVLQVGQKQFKAHRVVLAASSPVFKAMLQSECREKREGLVKIEGVREEVLSLALRYFYGEDIDSTSADVIQELLVFADRYEVSPLMSVCVDMLLKDKCSNIVDLLVLADTINSPWLKNLVLGRFQRHPKKKQLLNNASSNKIVKAHPELLAELLNVLL